MKYRPLWLGLGLCVLVITGFVTETGTLGSPSIRVVPVSGLQVAPGNTSAWNHPDSFDGVNAAPGNHRVIYEDDRIRLLEVVVLPGETEPLHGHKYPSGFAFDAVQPAVHEHMVDGNYDRKRGPGEKFPGCFSRGPEELHAVENIDTFPQHFLSPRV